MAAVVSPSCRSATSPAQVWCGCSTWLISTVTEAQPATLLVMSAAGRRGEGTGARAWEGEAWSEAGVGGAVGGQACASSDCSMGKAR